MAVRADVADIPERSATLERELEEDDEVDSNHCDQGCLVCQPAVSEEQQGEADVNGSLRPE